MINKVAKSVRYSVAAGCLAIAGVGGAVWAEPSGTLRWGAAFEPQGWNPQVQPNTTFSQLIYEGLLEMGPDGETLLPSLAHEWTVTPTDITFKLREGVVFHDGTPFNADAVIANIKNVQAASNRWRETVAGIKDVVKVDDYTVRLDLNTPSPALLFTLAQRGLHFTSPKALADGTWETKPIGTGPYTFNEAETVSGSNYVFDYFEGYHNPEAVGPERVEIFYLPDSAARYNVLLAGQVDAIDGDPTQVAAAESMGFANHYWSTLRYHLIMLDRKDLLGDVNVRKALCMSMPLDNINAARYEGLLKFPSQRFDEGNAAYVAGLEPYKYDIEGAKALLAEAGNPDINLELPSPDFMRVISSLAKESFDNSGLKTEIVMMPIPEYFQNFYSGRYPFLINTMTAENGGMFNYYPFRFGMGGAANTYDVEPPARLEELYQQALVAPVEEQPPLLQEMTQIIHDEALDCGYFDTVGVVHYNTNTIANIATTVWEPSALRYKDVRLVK
ncbi:ABC transporter substrate-binding protein [Sulfitobacter sp. F26204]|uniref:ABC transporter substrate-binding protein n=1 Tax=Sulfitobacter sp. F26204 TaxID=2996014 RepID=UPI00225E38F6|nr:ABC transporter substrate-binding protein [Sulfitobacter sp. F26204]MCX7560993.1 ABC transporter substrate-binding protein [Sulfitobacter sp. F26204]